MENLVQMTCVRPRSGEPPLGEGQIAGLHPQVSDWQIVERDGVKQLERAFKFKNFVEALAFTNQVGELAEEQDHHPTLHASTTLTITLRVRGPSNSAR